MFNLFTDFIIQSRHIRQERLDIFKNRLSFLAPVLTHAVADIDRTCYQIKRCVRTNMELNLMETVRDQLITLRRNTLYHFTGAVNNKQHKERLDLAELRQLLQQRLIIAICDIFSELIPNEEDARFGKVVILDNRGNPFFECIKAIYKSPVELTNNGGSSL